MKHEVTLHFRRDELLYDVKNAAYVIGDITPEESEHLRHQIQDIGEEGNVDRVTRIFDLAIAAITETLYPYTKVPFGYDGSNGLAPEGYTMVTDDTLEETATYEITMLVPDTFSQTSITLLERLIHALLVYRVLADWLVMLGDEHGAYWEAKYAGAIDDVKELITTRCGRVRRPLTPF